MRRLVLLLLVLLPAPAWARSETTRPLSGAGCGSRPGGVAGALAIVGEALGLSKGCLPADDPGRATAEEAEWRHIQEVYGAWQQDLCRRKRCVSNAFAAWVDIKDGGFFNEYEKLIPLMAGCFAWGSHGSLRLAQERIRYWTVQPVVYGKDTWIPGDNIHQVLQVKNTRTGEVHVLDGWTAAEKARSALKLGSRSRAKELSLADAVRTHRELMEEWGEPSQTEPCTSNRDALCDPSKCETEGKALR